MTEPRVYIEGTDWRGAELRHYTLDFELMLKYIQPVQNIQARCDFRVMFTVPGPMPLSKTICPYTEPPLGPAFVAPYDRVGEFHTVYTFCPPTAQHLPFTTDPIVFPYAPNTYLERRRQTKSDLRRRRKIYYAGTKAQPQQCNYPDKHYRHNFYGVRNRVAESLVARGLDVTIYGRGWQGYRDTRLYGDFQHNKLKEIEDCDADFVLCMENSSLPGYISEKIHNGFQSDRVVCYLGNPDILSYVPEEAFVNLNDLVNPATKEFDHDTLALLLSNMTQKEYDGIVEAAREWRATAELERRRWEQSHELTKSILRRMGCIQ